MWVERAFGSILYYVESGEGSRQYRQKGRVGGLIEIDL
jgi:hypothetical protein